MADRPAGAFSLCRYPCSSCVSRHLPMPGLWLQAGARLSGWLWSAPPAQLSVPERLHEPMHRSLLLRLHRTVLQTIKTQRELRLFYSSLFSCPKNLSSFSCQRWSCLTAEWRQEYIMRGFTVQPFSGATIGHDLVSEPIKASCRDSSYEFRRPDLCTRNTARRR